MSDYVNVTELFGCDVSALCAKSNSLFMLISMFILVVESASTLNFKALNVKLLILFHPTKTILRIKRI